MCGENRPITAGIVEPHAKMGNVHVLCPGSGDVPAPAATIMFWRAVGANDQSWIVVSRGEDHALELMGVDPDKPHVRLHLLEDDELHNIKIDRIITGSIEILFPEGRLWAVGTVAVEVRT